MFGLVLKTTSRSSLLKHHKKGRFYYYTSKESVKSIEEIADRITYSKTEVQQPIFIHLDNKNTVIYVVFCNSTKDTLQFNIDKNYEWEKFSSMLKILILNNTSKKVVIEKSCILHDKLIENFDVDVIPSKVFKKVFKVVKPLKEFKKQVFLKSIILGLVAFPLTILSHYVVPSYMNDIKVEAKGIENNLTIANNTKIKKLKKLIIKKETEENNGKRLAFSYEQIVRAIRDGR